VKDDVDKMHFSYTGTPQLVEKSKQAFVPLSNYFGSTFSKKRRLSDTSVFEERISKKPKATHYPHYTEPSYAPEEIISATKQKGIQSPIPAVPHFAGSSSIALDDIDKHPLNRRTELIEPTETALVLYNSNTISTEANLNGGDFNLTEDMKAVLPILQNDMLIVQNFLVKLFGNRSFVFPDNVRIEELKTLEKIALRDYMLDPKQWNM